MNTPEQMEKSTQAFLMMFTKMLEAIQSTAGLEKIAEKISQWDPMKLMTIFMAIAEPMQGGLKVLNHGDDWINNMMFKYGDDGQVLDIKFIDFQMSFWGSPANDLIYFFVSSVADDVKVAYFDDLIQFYYNELVDSLKKLHYDQQIPTLYELHLDLLQKGGACKLTYSEA
jgi:thiamine kinase-like enzyme